MKYVILAIICSNALNDYMDDDWFTTMPTDISEITDTQTHRHTDTHTYGIRLLRPGKFDSQFIVQQI